MQPKAEEIFEKAALSIFADKNDVAVSAYITAYSEYIRNGIIRITDAAVGVLWVKVSYQKQEEVLYIRNLMTVESIILGKNTHS